MNASSKAVSAQARAHWLSELSIAIDEAQWLAWRIGVVEGHNPEALELYVRLEIARAEVDALRGQLRQVPWRSSPPPENGSRNEPIGTAFQPPVATKPRLRKARLP